MATKEAIISLPNPRLHDKSRKVNLVSNDIHQIIEDMKSAALDWEDHRPHEVGVALAAIQIERPYKIIIVRNNFDDRRDRTFSVLINPEITKLEGEIEDDYEGCLSVPDIYGVVPRHSKIRLKALNERGQPVKLRAEGFLARVLQHEIDHLKGLMFTDLIKHKPRAFFKLTSGGKLKALNYEKDVKKSRLLWQ